MKEEKKDEKPQADLSKTRRIFLSGHVDEKTSREVIEGLLRLEVESPVEDIYLYIDSYGGYLDSMFAIIDVMNLVACDVQTICVGKAISAAAIILSAGKRGKRSITPSGRTLFHEIFAFCIGAPHDIEAEAVEIRRCQRLMEKTLAVNTRHSLAVIQQDMKSRRYMSAEDTLSYGIVDAIKVRGEKRRTR